MPESDEPSSADRPSLPVHVAVPLAAALVQAICEEVGARAAFIKGPAAVVQGLRESRSSSDIDVIVDPARFESVVTALTSRGWLVRFIPADELRAIPNHSVTLVHPDWPCDLDLHHFFVGTFAAPAVSFEALVEDGETHRIADRPIAMPSLVGHRLILTVNTVRDLGGARADREAVELAAHFRAHPDDWDAQVALATRTRSLSVLRVFAERHGLPDPGEDLGPAERKQLEFVMRYHSRGFGNLRYRLEDPDLPLPQKLRVLGRYLYKSPSVLRRENPSFSGGVLATVRANAARLGNGVKQWRDSRQDHGGSITGHGGPSSRPRASPTATGGFRHDLHLGPLPYAELRFDASGVTILNAESGPAAMRGEEQEPIVLDRTSAVEPAESAVVQDGGTRYLLPVAAAVFARNPGRTPGVLRLDTAGQEVLDLIGGGAMTLDDVVAGIAGHHGLDGAEIGPGIIDFVQGLLDAGVVVPAIAEPRSPR